jgi:small subunit ribosomal protein S1
MKKQKNYFRDYKELLNPPKIGEIMKGKVIGKTREGILLDLEHYKTGVISKQDLSQAEKKLAKIEVGEELFVKIMNLENKEGLVVLSLKGADEDLTWQRLEELKKENKEITLKVAGANKGGLVFNFSGIQGFLPASQLSKKNYPKIENPTPDRILEVLRKLIGDEMKVKIIRAEAREKRLILCEA